MAGLELIGFLTEQQQAKEASPEYQTSPTSSQSVKEPTNLSIAPASISPTPSIKKEQCSSSLTPGCSPSKLVERAIAFTKPGPNDEFIAEMGAIRAAEVDAEVDDEDETPQPLRKRRTMDQETRTRLLNELGGFSRFFHLAEASRKQKKKALAPRLNMMPERPLICWIRGPLTRAAPGYGKSAGWNRRSKSPQSSAKETNNES